MEYKISPWKHQLVAIERARDLAWFALFFEMGSGKSMTAINILRWKMSPLGRYLKTIIFCPPIVVPNWKDEFLKNSKIPPDKIVLLDGSGKDRVKQFLTHAYTAEGKPTAAFFVTNYEALLMKDLYTEFLRWAPEALIFDESHRLKNYKAQRSKLAQTLANPKKSKKPLTYLLSGSPVLNSPMDLFYPFLIMDGGATFGANFFVFRARFFNDKNAGMPKDRYFPDWQVRPGAIDEINALIFKFGMRVTKAECLDLPEEVSVTIKCKMQPAQARNYAEMKKDFVTFVGDNPASATLAIVKALRLMQITSGFLALNPKGEEMDSAKVVYPKTAKEEALKELLEEITPHSKVIVWAVWKENYGIIRQACEALGVEYVEVHGGISRAKQDEAVTRFQTDPAVRVFIGHPGSGGIGINLTCAPYSIFYSRTFSLEHWLQARARNHRGGQREKVTHYDLVCEETIDELVQARLSGKLLMSEQLLDNKKLVQDIALAMREQSY